MKKIHYVRISKKIIISISINISPLIYKLTLYKDDITNPHII